MFQVNSFRGNDMSILDKIKSNKLVKENIFVNRPVEYIGTGCIPINILFSGKVDGGIVKGKVMSISADSALGKSIIALKVARNAQKQGMQVLLIDTEFAYDDSVAKKFQLDQDNLLVVQSNSIEEVQHMIMSTVSPMTREEKDKLLIVIDSWGNLVTSKAVDDAIAGKDVRDMTKAQKKNEFARQLNGLNTTVMVVNQIYANVMDQFNPIEVAGGKGLFYVCSSIVLGTSKAKDKDADGDITGAVITAITRKGRFCREFSKLKYLIQHNGGIHPFYGILEDALGGGYVTKPSMGWYTRPHIENDKKWREAEIWKNSEEFWMPIIKDTDFKEYIESIYRFTGEINDTDFSDEDFNEVVDIVEE